MPARLTPAQRLTDPDGVPTKLAKAAVVGLMAIAAAAGWAAGPDREDPAPRARDVVALDRISGELPITGGEERPELRPAAALPRIRSGRGRAPAPAPAPALETGPSATPTPTTTPEPSPTPDITVVPVGTAPPDAEPPAPAPTVTPQPTSTPSPTFDSSG